MPARTIAITNHKGGVGKTTTTVNVAAALGRLGQRVLIVDFDSQAHSTVNLGVDRSKLEKSMYDVLVGKTSIQEILIETRIPGVTLAPSKVDLAVAEIDLQRVPGRDVVLREKLAPLLDRFDFIILDCPPSLGTLTCNALTAAHEVLIPVVPEYLALDGVPNLIEVMEMIRTRLNPKLSIGGVAITMCDPRVRGTMAMHVQTEQQARQFFGDKVYKTRIRRSARLTEPPSYGVSIFEHAPTSSGADDYMNLAKEVMGHGAAAKEGATEGARVEPAA